jgi:hypothetical protein
MKKQDLTNRIEEILFSGLGKNVQLTNDFTLLVTVVRLPSGALETIVNYQNLPEKIQYLINAYDDDLKLKTCPEIQLIDFILQ